MKNSLSTLFLITAYCLIGSTAAIAQINNSEAKIRVSGGNAVVEIKIKDEDRPISAPEGTLFMTDAKGVTRWIAQTPAVIASPFNQFTINIPPPPSPLAYNKDVSASYQVDLVYSASENGIVFKRKLTIPVSRAIDVELQRLSKVCNDVNQLRLHALANTDVNDARNVWNWINRYQNKWSTLASIAITPKGGVTEPYKIIFASSPPPAGKGLGVCIELDRPLPAGEFAASLTFTDKNQPGFPAALPGSVAAAKLAGTTSIGFPKNVVKESPSKWKLENTLDIGIAGVSSVADEEIPATATTPKTIERKRKTVGTVDVAIQYPYLLTKVQDNNKWVSFISPFFKAAVSTAKINKDTLSQNQVYFGFLVENRYRQFRNGKPIGLQRLEWKLTHASDRDFKQKEIYGSAVYKPVFDRLYKPYRINYDEMENDQPKFKGYGYTVEPSVGFDFGKTYSRRNPAPAVKPSDLIKRFNVGLKLSLDITKYVTLSAEDNFYIRWEDPTHKYRNWFTSQGNLNLFRSESGRAAHSLFVTFEKGWAPPFTGQQTNSFRVGYRVIGNFCDIYCR